jgi:hypothetical protein
MRIRRTAVSLFAFLVLALAAQAGEYHYGDTLFCADCHTMHFSMAHRFGGPDPVSVTAAPDGDWIPGVGPNDYLLKAPSPNDLCKQCHDGTTFAPDVVGDHSNNYVRQAGALTTGTAPYENFKGHTLGVRARPPGGFSNITLECITCHDYHGNPSYRNVDELTYAKGTNDTTKDIFLRSHVLGDLANNYSIDNVDFNEPNQSSSQFGDFCRSCHFQFHGSAGDSNMGGAGGTQWRRHPTADANIGGITLDDQHSSLARFASRPYRVKVMSPTGNWGTQGIAWTAPPADLTPTCVSCHKSHGNENTFALIFLAGSGPVDEQGDPEGNAAVGGYQRERTLCAQCHVQ